MSSDDRLKVTIDEAKEQRVPEPPPEEVTDITGRERVRGRFTTIIALSLGISVPFTLGLVALVVLTDGVRNPHYRETLMGVFALVGQLSALAFLAAEYYYRRRH